MILPPTPSELAELADKARAFNLTVHPAQTPRVPIRNLRRRLSPDMFNELVRRYQEGEHSTALSKEYGISKTGLLQLFRAEGVSLRR